jgi:hypothetical protein
MKSAIPQLTLNGQKFELHPEPASFARIRAFLDKHTPGDVLTTDQMATKAGITASTLRSSGNATAEALKDYREKVGRTLLWGSLTTIKELRRLVAAGK